MSLNEKIFIKINLNKKRLSIGEIDIQFQPMEFVYYLYFAERTAAGLPHEVLSDKVKFQSFLEKIIEYHREIFPNGDSQRQSHEIALIKTRKGENINLGNVRAIISKCNKKIREELNNINLTKHFEVVIGGSRGGKTYGLNIPPENIQLPSPKVYPTFKRKLKCYESNESLSNALIEMKKNNYSQIVIRFQNKIKLITTDGLATWLIKMMNSKTFDLTKVLINDILEYERDDNISFFARNRTVIDARKEFSDTLSKNRPKLYAIIITDTGKADEEPLGIITPWDFLDPKYW